jgi:hypothetical protein
MDRHAFAAIFSRNIKTVGSFVGLVALLAASPASATLTLIDDPVFGPMSLVLDTTTNLEWLRVDLTYNGPGSGGQLAVLGELGPGQEFAGFRFAAANDWAGLMGEFGFPTMPGASNCFSAFPCNIDPLVEASFTSLFGIQLEYQVGYAYTPPPPQIFFDGVTFLPNGIMIYNGFGEGCLGGCPVAALVRDAAVPEPPSIWMIIAGLLAFPVARRLFPTTRRRHQLGQPPLPVR